MTRLAQLLSVLFVLVLGSAALTSIFLPLSIVGPSGFEVASDYGITNLRTLGAPTLSLAIITAIAAFRTDWLLLLPAAMYFLFNLSARLISVFAEGYDPVMLRGLLITTVLVTLSQFALQIFRSNGRNVLRPLQSANAVS